MIDLQWYVVVLFIVVKFITAELQLILCSMPVTNLITDDNL